MRGQSITGHNDFSDDQQEEHGTIRPSTIINEASVWLPAGGELNASTPVDDTQTVLCEDRRPESIMLIDDLELDPLAVATTVVESNHDYTPIRRSHHHSGGSVFAQHAEIDTAAAFPRAKLVKWGVSPATSEPALTSRDFGRDPSPNPVIGDLHATPYDDGACPPTNANGSIVVDSLDEDCQVELLPPSDSDDSPVVMKDSISRLKISDAATTSRCLSTSNLSSGDESDSRSPKRKSYEIRRCANVGPTRWLTPRSKIFIKDRRRSCSVENLERSRRDSDSQNHPHGKSTKETSSVKSGNSSKTPSPRPSNCSLSSVSSSADVCPDENAVELPESPDAQQKE